MLWQLGIWLTIHVIVWYSNGSGLPIERFGVQIPAMAEIWFEISVPPAPPSQLSYDEYNDRTLSVGR